MLTGNIGGVGTLVVGPARSVNLDVHNIASTVLLQACSSQEHARRCGPHHRCSTDSVTHLARAGNRGLANSPQHKLGELGFAILYSCGCTVRGSLRPLNYSSRARTSDQCHIDATARSNLQYPSTGRILLRQPLQSTRRPTTQLFQGWNAMKPLRNGVSLLMCSGTRQALLCVAGKVRTHVKDAALERLPAGEALWIFESLWHENARALRAFAYQVGLSDDTLARRWDDHRLWKELTLRIERGDLWMFRPASGDHSSTTTAAKGNAGSTGRVLELRTWKSTRAGRGHDASRRRR